MISFIFQKASGVGFQFTDPYFYDGLGFAGQPHAVQCADNSNWLGECGDLKICVNAGTTHVDVLKHIFPLPNLVPRDTKELFLEEFVNGGCNVIAGEQNDISEVVVRMAGYEGDCINGEQVLSKEPLGECFDHMLPLLRIALLLLLTITIPIQQPW